MKAMCKHVLDLSSSESTPAQSDDRPCATRRRVTGIERTGCGRGEKPS